MPALTQTIDEIADLQKQKTVSELRTQMKQDAPPAALEVRPAVVRVQQQVPPPAVVSIFGVSADNLQASISEGAAPNIRVRVGDETPSGWTVERISRSAVTFARSGQEVVAKSKSERSSTLRRVTVAWGTSQSTVLADQRAAAPVAAGIPAIPDIGAGKSYVVGPGGALQPLPAIQLLPTAPLPNSSR